MSLTTAQSDKIIIYQLFTRIFANTNVTNKFNGNVSENGTTKFKDINDNALRSIKNLGCTHVWYTGIIEHATLTETAASKSDHPQVVKGIAGSPYAIKDYYDVNPYLATDPANRLNEFKDLIKRTHKNGLKLFIDFVPNHVARQYKSDVKPKGTLDFGQRDDKTASFSKNNNFYYLPGKKLVLDQLISPPIKFKKIYEEIPAKATGNDVFSENPNINDWYETIKLNYGVDYVNNRKTHFEPIPDTWFKMKDILLYWSKMGVDGFRCDMAEMVPVEFWEWVIPEIKKYNPQILFTAEIYNPDAYKSYIFKGKFDYLYDKVGLYDALRRLVSGSGDAMDITRVWQKESGEFSNKMLRFLENHDEQRITSSEFGGNAESAFPAYAVSAFLHAGPLMLYYGQELGVIPTQAEGFQGNDGRTTIFDFWGLPEFQKYIDKGKFDDGKLNSKSKSIRDFYKTIHAICHENAAISSGQFHDLQYLNMNNEGYDPHKIYSFMRHSSNQTILVVANFDKTKHAKFNLNLPETGFKASESMFDIFNKKKIIEKVVKNKVSINLEPNSFLIYEL